MTHGRSPTPSPSSHQTSFMGRCQNGVLSESPPIFSLLARHSNATPIRAGMTRSKFPKSTLAQLGIVENCVPTTVSAIFAAMTDTTDDRTTRIKAASDYLRQSFAIACKAHALDKNAATAVLKGLLHATPAVPLSLPVYAPEQWSDRTVRKENPVMFIHRVYGSLLGQGLARRDLLKLDPKLYNALAGWERRYPEQRMHELPTISEIIDSRIAELTLHCSQEELRQIATALQGRAARRTRARKMKPDIA